MNKAKIKTLQLEVLSEVLENLENKSNYYQSEVDRYNTRLEGMEDEERKDHYYNQYIEEYAQRKTYALKLIAYLKRKSKHTKSVTAGANLAGAFTQ
jgi:glutamate synthase domain-containing protein 2